MKLNDEELMILSEILTSYKFDKLKAKIDKELDKHNWKIDGKPSMYDNNYKCTKCGQCVSESVDSIHTKPKFGCTEIKPY